MKLTCVLVALALLLISVETANIRKLKTTPTGLHVADWNEYMGKWYLYAVVHSCSWKGSEKFTDWTFILTDYKHQTFTYLDQWRKDDSCSYTKATSTITSPGCYTVVDQVGDLWSSKAVVVHADKRFQHYVLLWGCVKYIGDTCADYYYTVKTRHPKPGKPIIAEINRKLAELWDSSLAEMNIVSHTESCDRSPPPTNIATPQRWRKY